MAIQELNSYNRKIQKIKIIADWADRTICVVLLIRKQQVYHRYLQKKPVSVTMISRININIKQNQYVYRKHRINVSTEKMKT